MFFFLLLLCLVGLTHTKSWAQSNQGAISGTVQDSSGAVLPHAPVIARNRDTGSIATAESSESGAFRFPALPLGTYDISIALTGFKTAKYSGIIVQVNSIASVDISLEIGSSSEAVTVEASAPSVQSESSELGGVVTTKQVIELPLALGGVGALRSPEAFVFLQPGTIGPGTQNTANGIRQIKIGGAQNQGLSILVDGLDQLRSENASFFDEESPSVEAIQEFKLTTSNPSAEYGRTTGGVESFATKAGTNSYHGSVYDIFRNDVLDANTYFNNGRKVTCLQSAGSSASAVASCNAVYRRPSDKQNDYGLSLGGPLSIPHIYKGRERSFFFFSWEQFRQSTGGPVTSTVPTQAMRTGDFSALLTSNVLATNPCDGTPVFSGQIFDPATTRSVNGVLCRTAFAGNVMPANRITAVARGFLNYYPVPNGAGTFNNYTINQPYPITNTTYTVRIDHNVSTNNKVFGSWTARQNTSQKNPRTLPDPVDPNQWNQNFVTHLFRFGLTSTINSHMVNQYLMGLNRTNAKNFNVSAGGTTNYSQQLGIGNFTSNVFPITTVGESIPVLSNGNNGDPVDNGLRFADTLSIERGKHNLRVGGDYRFQQFLTFNGPIPKLNFARAQTAATTASVVTANSGNGFASLLLGQPSNGAINVASSQPRWISSYWAIFLQDDYKIFPNLTLNLGIRYDVDLPRHETRNRTSNFSETALDPISGKNGALVFGTTCNCNAKWIDAYYKDISPRIGFAFTPYKDGKMVLRGGYSVLYAPMFYSDGGSQMNTGYKANPSFTSVNSFSPAFDLSSGFPAYTAPPILNPSYFEGQVVAANYIRSDMNKPAMTQQWNLQVQQELAQDLIFTIGYAGERGTRLRSNLENINNIPKSAFALGDNLNRTLTSNTAGVAAPFPAFYSVFGNNVQTAQALRPFPQYQQVQTSCCLQNIGQSSYHALLSSLQRRFRNGLNLQVSYTWSKNMTNSDSIVLNTNSVSAIQDPTNLKGEKSVSTQDLTNVFVTSFIQELPFGRNRRFLNHGFESYLAGGWQIGAVLRYQTGTPISFGCASSIPGWDNCIRFNLKQGASLASAVSKNGKVNPFVVTSKGSDPAVNSLFNLNVARDAINGAFVDPNTTRNGGAYQLGTLSRVQTMLRLNGYSNEDLSIIKNTSITERTELQLKLEILNAFNRHAFGLPSTTPTDTLFGVPTTTLTTPRNMQITARIRF